MSQPVTQAGVLATLATQKNIANGVLGLGSDVVFVAGDVPVWNDSTQQFELLSANSANGYARLDANAELLAKLIAQPILLTDEQNTPDLGQLVVQVDDLDNPTTIIPAIGDGSTPLGLPWYVSGGSVTQVVDATPATATHNHATHLRITGDGELATEVQITEVQAGVRKGQLLVIEFSPAGFEAFKIASNATNVTIEGDFAGVVGRLILVWDGESWKELFRLSGNPQASGYYASAFGAGIALGYLSFAYGLGRAERMNEFAMSARENDRKASFMPLGASGSPAELTLDGAAPYNTGDFTDNRVTLKTDRTAVGLLRVVARNTTGQYAVETRFVAHNGSIVDGPTEVWEYNPSGWTGIALSVSNGQLVIDATSSGVGTTQWSGWMQLVEVSPGLGSYP